MVAEAEPKGIGYLQRGKHQPKEKLLKIKPQKEKPQGEINNYG